jgi:hypothetical protein
MQIESFALFHNKDWLGASEKLWRNGKKIMPGFLFAFSHRRDKSLLIGHYEFREASLISLGFLICETVHGNQQVGWH